MPVLLETILLILMSCDKKTPNLSLMHLIVSKVLSGEKLLTSHLTVLGLRSTSLVPPCRVDLELLCCCNLFSNKGCEFAVSAVTSCTVVQKSKLTLPSPEAGTPSSSPSPLSSPKNSILCAGRRTDFFTFIINPRF